MDDPQPMRLGQRLGDLTTERDRRWQIEGTALQPLGQRLSVDVLHRDVAVAVGLADFVDRADVRVIKTSGGLCLAHETLARGVVCGNRTWQQFQRHSPVQAGVFGEVDVAHAPGAQR